MQKSAALSGGRRYEMADSTIMSVLVGGDIGIAGTLIGSFVGPLVLEWRKQVTEKKKKKAEKLEELVYVIYEHHHWLQRLYLINVRGATLEMSLSPFAKIEAMTHIYFPQFDTPLKNFAAAATTYQELMLRNAPILQQLDLSIEAHVTVNTGFIEARADYLQCGNIFLDELKSYAKSEFQ